MPAPSTSVARLRPEIRDSFEEFPTEMLSQGFVSTEVLPVFQVEKSSGNFGRIPVEQLLKKRSMTRAPGASYQRSEWTFTEDSFQTTEYGVEEPVDDREAELYSDFFRAEMIATARATGDLMRALETRAAAIYEALTNTTAAGTTWDTQATATPIANVETAAQAVYSKCGIWPNTVIISVHALRACLDAAEIVDRLKYAGIDDPKQVSLNALASLFKVERIIVPGSTTNSANEGQTAVFSSVWDKTKAHVAVIPRSGDIREPGVGRIFHWPQDGSQIGGTVETYREEASRSNIVRVRHDVDEKLLYNEAGNTITGVL